MLVHLMSQAYPRLHVRMQTIGSNSRHMMDKSCALSYHQGKCDNHAQLNSLSRQRLSLGKSFEPYDCWRTAPVPFPESEARPARHAVDAQPPSPAWLKPRHVLARRLRGAQSLIGHVKLSAGGLSVVRPSEKLAARDTKLTGVWLLQ